VKIGNISTENTSVTLEGLDAAKTYTVKIMIWEDMESIIPLSALAEY